MCFYESKLDYVLDYVCNSSVLDYVVIRFFAFTLVTFNLPGTVCFYESKLDCVYNPSINPSVFDYFYHPYFYVCDDFVS